MVTNNFKNLIELIENLEIDPNFRLFLILFKLILDFQYSKILNILQLATGKLLSPVTQLILREIYDNSTDICTMKYLTKNTGFLVFINQSQVFEIYSKDLKFKSSIFQFSNLELKYSYYKLTFSKLACNLQK